MWYVSMWGVRERSDDNLDWRRDRHCGSGLDDRNAFSSALFSPWHTLGELLTNPSSRGDQKNSSTGHGYRVWQITIGGVSLNILPALPSSHMNTRSL